MTIKTSDSHPLGIDTVEVAVTGARASDAAPGGSRNKAAHPRLGLTFCPGKKQADAMTGHWERDLGKDLGRVHEWGAQAVVTVMEPHELDELGVSSLNEAVEAAGLDWYPVPMKDGEVPDNITEAYWFWAGTRLRRLLVGGGAAVIHCKGGLGRTGTMAARLLVEMGEVPEKAIDRVRTARKGSIETPAQEKHVRGLTSAGNPRPAMGGRAREEPDDMRETTPGTLPGAPTLAERLLGCLLGGAVGDGFGFAIEFDSLDIIRKQHGPRGLTEPLWLEGDRLISATTRR